MTTTYVLNGVDLDDNVLGTSIQSSSEIRSGIARRSVDLQRGVGDGNTPVPSTAEAPFIRLVVRVPEPAVDTFQMLIDAPGPELVHDNRVAEDVELLSAPSREMLGYTDFTLVYRVNAMFWRDVAATTSPAAAITASSVDVDVLEGLKAPVRDALIRLHGGLTDAKVRDSRGSFFRYGAVLATNEYLRFESATGRAFITTTDTWAGGTPIHGVIANGPGPYWLQLSPVLAALDEDPVATLTVESSARAGSPTIEVRAARAYPV